MITIKQRFTGKVLMKIKSLSGANLQGANLRGADLSWLERFKNWLKRMLNKMPPRKKTTKRKNTGVSRTKVRFTVKKKTVKKKVTRKRECDGQGWVGV